ncbi:MAG: PIN domain-containing protein [Acidobacteriota bacterium]|nr:PIN domain-containing protein [Acidobacteriota bacterium]
MPDPDFLDTNVLIYAYDPSDPRKQQIARGLVKRALAGEACVSSQVLAELATILLHKTSPRADPGNVIAVLDVLAPIKLITSDGDMVRRAVQAHSQYGMHFYDGMIAAAAERGGCARILSEDMNSGQKYFGVLVENPFQRN